jgi:competence protein ComEA
MQRLLLALGLALCPLIALAAININTATKDELVALPGIGPAKAQAIVDYRKAHGPFKTVEELKDVKGIGAKRFEKLKPELAVTGPSTAKAAAKADAKPAASSRAGQGEITAAAKRDAGSGKPK